MFVKKVKVKIDANEFEIFETQDDLKALGVEGKNTVASKNLKRNAKNGKRPNKTYQFIKFDSFKLSYILIVFCFNNAILILKHSYK